jgi:nucleoside-diphosphate-sugar epimerase
MPCLYNKNAVVLVTGANGFLGTWLVGTLLEKGYSVRAVVRDVEKGSHLLEKYAGFGRRLSLTIVKEMEKVIPSCPMTPPWCIAGLANS